MQSEEIEKLAKEQGIEINGSSSQQERLKQIANAIGMNDFNSLYDNNKLEERLRNPQNNNSRQNDINDKYKPLGSRQNTANTQTTPKKGRKLFNKNGYKGENNYKNKNLNGNPEFNNAFTRKMRAIKEKQKKRQAKDAIVNSAAAVGGPMAGITTKALMNTKVGDKAAEAYINSDSHSSGIYNAQNVIKREKIKIRVILYLCGFALVIIFIVLLVSLFVKNADSLIFSNQNGGTVESDHYVEDDKKLNIFANYPGLYEKIVKVTDQVSKKYQVDIDKYLIIATLIAPVENELIVPVEDGSCGEEKCYYFQGESKTWEEFVDLWGDQAELLAKMQLLTYTNNQNEIKVDCGENQNMEQYAQNDLEVREKYAFWWINPVNWFSEFRGAADAEVNAKCVEAKNGASKVPTVRVLSIERADYYATNNAEKEITYVKKEETGGVYFWNLVNKNGFFHQYLKDYLSDEESEDPDKNYEINRKTIVDITNYVYSYYDVIRRDCDGFQVIEGGGLDKINFREDGSSPIYSLDFEDIFVGGSVLATYGGAKGEVAKAQAIITRSEAYNYIVEGGGKVITGSAKMGCWWWKYNPTYDPSYENQADNPNYDPDYPKVHFPDIYEAVTETRGIVVTKYGETTVMDTEYDAFCPTTREAIGGFYYLPDGQRNLPIDTSRFSVSKSRVECPCFQNRSSRPKIEYSDTLENLLEKRVGTPAQTTTETCWTPTGSSKADDSGKTVYGYEYAATGGHGVGVSQHGMAYFSQFGYDYEAILKLFLERNNYGITLKKLENAIEDGECDNYGYYKESGEGGGSGSSDGNSVGDSNYNSIMGGTPLTDSLSNTLASQGNSIEDLNNCIGDGVTSAGYGTRAGVVEAAVGLLQCTMDLTGGYTYPYDHYGGSVAAGRNPDINGKLGVNSLWGTPGGTGCATGNCKLGLNCATFVRWSMCNGGMDLCSSGSTFAHEMFDTSYFPGGVKVSLSPQFSVLSGNADISSAEEAVNKIQPGDLLYSNSVSGGENHVMVVVGTTDSSITIAENGRKTRVFSKNELISSGSMIYQVMLLDDYYANSGNQNSLSWE